MMIIIISVLRAAPSGSFDMLYNVTGPTRVKVSKAGGPAGSVGNSSMF